MIADIPDHKFVVMKKFPESIFNSGEMHTTTLRIIEIIEIQIGDDVFIIRALPLLKKSTSNLSITIGRTTDSSSVDLLYDKDGTRGSNYLGLRDLSKAYSNNPDPVLANAGKILNDVFRDLGWSIAGLGYAAESSKLNALIDKLEKEPLKGALASIGALTWFESLKTSQIDFENTYKQKVNANVAEEYPKTREARLSMARYLKALLSYIDIMAEIEGDRFNNTTTKINEVITEITSIARSRQTRKEDEAKKNTEETK